MKLTNIFSVLILIVLFVLGYQSFAKEVPVQEQRVLYEAYKLMEQGETVKALNRLQEFEVGWEQKKSVNFYLLLGNCHYELQDPGKAKEIYTHGLKENSDDFNLRLNHALACYALEEYKLAGKSFEKAFDLKEERDLELLYRASFCFYQAKEYKQCIQALEKLFEKAGSPKSSWLKLYVHTCLELNLTRKAKAKLEDLLQRRTEDPELWELLAKLNLQLKEYLRASVCLEVVYKLRQPKAKDLENLADLYEYINAPLLAANTLQRLKRFVGLSEEQQIRLSRLYSKGLRYKSAIEVLNQALENRETSGLYLQKAQVCYFVGFYAKAIKALNNCLRLDKDNSQAMILMAYSAWHLMDWSKAKAYFAKAKKHNEVKDQAKQGLQAVNFILKTKKSLNIRAEDS